MDRNPVARGWGLVAGNRLSQIYLVVVTALLLWALGDALFVEHADASFATVVPVLATAPVSVLLVSAVPEGPAVWLLGTVVVGALVNAAVVEGAFRLARRPSSSARER